MKQEYQDILEEARLGETVLKKRLKVLATRGGKQTEVLKVSHQLHEEIFARIDCRACANCCRQLGPRVLSPDIGPLAKALGMKPTTFEQAYLAVDEDGDKIFRSLPCPFLEGYDCTVYDQRPRSCHDYPHTADRDIHKKLHRLGLDAQYCPAAWLIANRLVDHFGI